MEAKGFSVNAVGISLPYGKNGVYVRAVTNIMYRVSLDIGVDVLWDGKNRVELQLASRYHGKVRFIITTETLCHRDDALLHIAYVMLIWAALIPADRWHCSLWP